MSKLRSKYNISYFIRGGEHSLEREEPTRLEFRLHRLRQVLQISSVRLPEDVENALYGISVSRLSPTWRNNVTKALVQGMLPEGMTADEVVTKVREALRSKKGKRRESEQ